jgi:hypothetical protein
MVVDRGISRELQGHRHPCLRPLRRRGVGYGWDTKGFSAGDSVCDSSRIIPTQVRPTNDLKQDNLTALILAYRSVPTME